MMTAFPPDVLNALAGSIVGLVLGLIGGGGSIIAVPLLLYVVGVPSVHTAIGTSAIAVAISAFGNMLTYAWRGLVKWPCALVFSASGILGSFAGARLALSVDESRLLFLFAGLMLIIGVVMLLRRDAEGDPEVRLTATTAGRMLPWLIPMGLAVGTLAGFFGIGGGFLVVPGLLFATGMPLRHAIGTSLVAITLFGAATATHYAWAGVVDWRSVAMFVGGGVVGSIGGQYLSSFLAGKTRMLQILFGLFVIAIGGAILLVGKP
jgi:uncharacterized protein